MTSTNIYYVYAYIRKSNGTPYYIGKGTGKRAYNYHTKYVKVPPKEQIVFLETNLSEIGAFAIERRMINWWGKKCDNTGVLINKTDGGTGGSIKGIKKSKWKELSKQHHSKCMKITQNREDVKQKKSISSKNIENQIILYLKQKNLNKNTKLLVASLN